MFAGKRHPPSHQERTSNRGTRALRVSGVGAHTPRETAHPSRHPTKPHTPACTPRNRAPQHASLETEQHADHATAPPGRTPAERHLASCARRYAPAQHTQHTSPGTHRGWALRVTARPPPSAQRDRSRESARLLPPPRPGTVSPCPSRARPLKGRQRRDKGSPVETGEPSRKAPWRLGENPAPLTPGDYQFVLLPSVRRS